MRLQYPNKILDHAIDVAKKRFKSPITQQNTNTTKYAQHTLKGHSTRTLTSLRLIKSWHR